MTGNGKRVAEAYEKKAEVYGQMAQVYGEEAEVFHMSKHTPRILAQHVWPAHQHGVQARTGGKGTADESLYGKD